VAEGKNARGTRGREAKPAARGRAMTFTEEERAAMRARPHPWVAVFRRPWHTCQLLTSIGGAAGSAPSDPEGPPMLLR
jgi:hypothetical protein